ncbi:MAG: DUF4011 domain-containing protein [Prevotella sp.]|nr:DUF4011 domain-containing protein [Prevotella sp.]
MTDQNIRIDYLKNLNYAIWSNGYKCLRVCELTNDSEDDWRDIIVRINGEMLIPSESHIDLVPHGATVSAEQLSITPDAGKLRELTESTSTQFTLSVEVSGQEAFTHTYPIRLLAFNEWTGLNEMPETTAAFVIPNSPSLNAVKLAAAKHLERLTGSPSLDEYQTQDHNRVRAMVASVYEALREQGIVYITLPPSFEKAGQRIRLADEVLSQKTGTCADLALLMASCLEGIGLNTLLVFTKGHMMLGCWLVDKRYPQIICDDVSFLNKSVADGISEMVLVETTMLTQDNVSFEQAVTAAEDMIHNKPNEFVTAIDVKTCRLNGVRPIPTSEKQVDQEGIAHNNVTDEVRELRQYQVDDETERKLTRQQIWERKLLDFSLRNNLLNLRTGKRVIPFVSFNIDKLEDYLQAKEDFSILPSPLKKDIAPDESGIYDSRLHREELEQFVIEGLQHKQMISFWREDELKTGLKNLFRASRTALEENGANTLFLVLGLLKWYETDKSVKPRFAPLLLEPVDIVKKSGNNYVLRMREEDITFNTTLVEMMKQQYDINITGVNPLPVDESGIDVREVFSRVRVAIKDNTRWDVVEESLLGLFSFSKFVMWNDIHNNADKMRQNPVVESLIQKRLVNVTDGSTTDTRQVDSSIAPGQYAIPMDVDSSQLEAVIESGEGRSFILYGPPGTGKSQTITNMIANALYNGRRVLFVAEKMAALEVVQKRLAKIGLDPFCLEMHSNKMTKGHLLGQLNQALEITRLKSPQEYEQESQALFEQRKHLITYVNLLHTPQPSGMSLYEYISRYTAIKSEDAIAPAPAFINGIDVQRIADAERALAELAPVFAITGAPGQNPLNGLLITDPSYDAQQKTSQLLSQLSQLLPKAISAIQSLCATNGLTIPGTAAGAQWAEQFADAVAKTPALNKDILAIATNKALGERWQQVIAKGKTRDEARAALSRDYAPGILQVDAKKLATDWNTACDKWFLPRIFAKKGVVKSLKGLSANVTSDNMPTLISQLQQCQQLSGEIAPHQAELTRIFGALATPGNEQWQKMEESLRQASGIQAMMQQTDAPAAYVPPVDRDATLALDLSAVRQVNSLLRGAVNYCALSPKVTLDTVVERLPQWQVNISQSRDWSQWCLRRRQLLTQHLAPVVDYLEQGHDQAEACDAMLRGLYKKLSMDIIDKDPELQVFNGLIFEEKIAHYRDKAKQFQELTKKALYCTLASRIPSLTIEASHSSEIGTLKRMIASGGRGTTIRHIIDQIPTLLPKLCPCMLMSPISVAQFIDLDQEKFDIVVFDEASQMPTSEAIGAIARGKALIVVGDPKQMPPTSFFITTNVDESEAENDDMESILDDCITLSFPDHYLTWHYRSRHESLIAFSNSQYYDGKLFTFPSVDDRASKVSLVNIDGTYDMGKTRCNRAEADAIVKEVVRRLRDPELSKRSIGIVSFSKVQQDLIEDILVDELGKDPQLERKAYDCEEPIFIKNLENVQGDERDVILFSVGYGPDKSGKVSMNFGPLNNQGGERRLNVAVSRARYEMIVFSTLRAEQIDLNRSQAKGVEGLKRFLEFAKSGRMPVSSAQIDDQVNTTMVDSIASELRAHGYQVDTRVGRSRFKVDLAIIDPKHTDRYLLGITCDGSNYYETKTERDREICQPGVLQGLGWKLMRVWTIDWFLNREKVLDRILDQLDSLSGDKTTPTIAGTNAEKKQAPAPQPLMSGQAKSSAPTSAGVSDEESGQMKKLSSIPFAVSEDDLLEIKNDMEQDYVRADIPIKLQNATQEAVSLHRRQIAADLQTIIAREQPVTYSYLQGRIRQIYGQSRMTDRLKHIIDTEVSKSYIDPSSAPDDPTIWMDAKSAQGYKNYRKANGREPEQIPTREIKNLLRMAVSQQLSLSHEDLLRQAAKLLGFARRTPRIDAAVNRAVDQLCNERFMTCQGGTVTMC